MEIKICRHCQKEFSKMPKTTYKKWSGQFCCSKQCAAKVRNTYWLKPHEIKKGQRLSPKTEFKKGISSIGKDNVNWKGDEASYFAKHIWANNHFGRPRFCEHCKCSNKTMYHWANISKEFKRERDDWMRLCVSCHKKFDLDRLD